MHLAALALAGGAGCALRVAVRDGLARRGVRAWWTIAGVNAVGAFAMGAASCPGAMPAGTLGHALASGILAGWTTSSAFSWDVVRLWGSGARATAAAIWCVTVAGCPLLAFAGSAAVRATSGGVP